MKKIYLDYAALTPVSKDVTKEMKKYSAIEYGNPSSLHLPGVSSKKAIDDAKKRISQIFKCHSDEIYFTSGGTESNYLALKDEKILISEIEHSSIMKLPYENKIKVEQSGRISLKDLEEKIDSNLSTVSVLLVNNEIGTIQDIYEISKIVRRKKKELNQNILLHTDASQALCCCEIDMQKMGADMMTLDGSKIYGPRGMGILIVKRGVKILNQAGTENIPGIMGLAKAIESISKNRHAEEKRVSELKNFFFSELLKINKDIKVNANIENATPYILNVEIPNIDSEFFILQLDAKGIYCSTKSACLRDEDESYVLKAIGSDSKKSVRFSFGRDTNKSDIKYCLKIIKNILVK